MHPISDKELDKLFQQHFEDAEIDPSASVWGKINHKMNGESRRKPLSSFWMAAAGVILIIGASLWFYRPVQVIRLHGAAPVVKNHMDEHVLPVIIEKKTTVKVPVRQNFGPAGYKSVRAISPKQVETEVPELKPTLIADPAPVTTVSTVKKVNSPASKRKQEVRIPPRYTGDQSRLDVTQPDMLAQADLSEEEFAVEESSGRQQRKVRSIGSLVNFVVGQVDKREDKIIEFKDSDEGSEIRGINLGLIKIKSKK